ncbi:TonB-dependent receptor [Flavivirga sp. 57AJ16]|uniref:SusC/RagA family TonB-linked outer membrane protein n=1 Tax=Flavivirga sp. 57AJ16 TaxID=3025307 RepID=UPI002366B9E1|nr:TonB-dependent receptor [Flavivirga sp. 57AJ16]MDD7887721.1 TonB-dependent receptor [Flavivirga sp. 57AJ16]
MRKVTICLLIFVFGLAHAQTQKKIVTGTISDENGLPLPGASIIVKGTTNGQAADFDGNYTITAKSTDILVISYVGYKDKELTIGDQTTINITLEVDLNSLDEIVLVSFGEQTKKSVISSISTVKPSELKIPSSNLTTALAGRIPGLISYQRGGEPGNDNAEFFVRGVATFGYGSSPLILIDGVELTIDDLRRLQPDDIDSFSIMKDASATALYGARGANGVIYVTTKEGTQGKVKFSGRFETSFSMPTKDIELADPITYMKMGNEAVRTRDPLAILPYSLEKIAKTEAGADPILYPTTDWYNTLFKDYTVNNRFNFSMNGGGQKARYYVSLAGSQDNGILKVPDDNEFNNNIKYKQYNVRSNINLDLTETTELKLSFNLNSDDFNGPRQGGTETYKRVMRANPVLFRPYYANEGEYEFTNHVLFGNYSDSADGGPSYLNPYADMVAGYTEGTRTKLIAQVQISQDLDFLTNGLDFQFMFNTTKESSYQVDRAYNPYFYSAREDLINGGIALTPLNEESGTEYLDFNQRDRYSASTTYAESRLTYFKDFDEKNTISGLAVFTLNNRLASLPENDSRNLEKSLPYRNMGLSGRLTYAYDQKYFFEWNFGYNGSERFAKNERWGFFPSLAIGWMVSDEKFMKGTENIITNLKLKTSYGLVGNDQIGSADDRFFYLSRVEMNADGYTFGEDFDNSQNGVEIRRYGNDQITWETAKKFNFGIELGLFNDLDINVDIFSEKRADILWDRVLPSTLGLQSGVKANIGEAKSSGIDGSIVYTKAFSSGAWIQARGNYTYATNKITKIDEPDYSETPWLSRIGQPIDQQWGYIAERLFIDQNEVNNSPEQFGEYSGGDIKYKDINGDGRITGLDQVPIGNPSRPEIVYGIGISAGFKGFDISCFFQGAANSTFWLNTSNGIANSDPNDYIIPFWQQRQLLKAIADDYWSETNRNSYALWPRLSPERLENNFVRNTWFMQDGAFLRLKQAEIGYSLSDKIVSKWRMNKVRFYASGTNLFVLSKFKLWDPELAGNGLEYPNQRVFNLGVNVSL